MQGKVMWAPWTGPGLEHLRLVQDADGVTADGLVLGTQAGDVFRVHYRIHCDWAWRVRAVEIHLLDEGNNVIRLRSDGRGGWQDGEGKPLPALAGCIDIDISATPFTNTLPIRRLSLHPGESVALAVVYVALPELVVQPEQQRYTCLARTDAGGVYKFESLPPGGFTADLPVDVDGLVLDYPGLFRRVWTRG